MIKCTAYEAGKVELLKRNREKTSGPGGGESAFAVVFVIHDDLEFVNPGLE